MSDGVLFDSGPVMWDRVAQQGIPLRRCKARYPWLDRGRCILPERFNGGHWHPDDGTQNIWHLDEAGNQW
jgi:hypothetical protein